MAVCLLVLLLVLPGTWFPEAPVLFAVHFTGLAGGATSSGFHPCAAALKYSLQSEFDRQWFGRQCWCDYLVRISAGLADSVGVITQCEFPLVRQTVLLRLLGVNFCWFGRQCWCDYLV